jgi:threonine aldolase
MRQAGFVAATALYALEHNVDRLAEDHARAKRLAGGLAEAGLQVDPAATESNFVAIDVGSQGLATVEAVARIADAGVLVSTLRPGVLRAVTYLGVTDDDIERAVDAIPRALGVLAAV